MNARAAGLVAGGRDRMPLADGQVCVDPDLSVGNLRAGSLLAVSQAVLQASDAPHPGCAEFAGRSGAGPCALSAHAPAGGSGCAG